jgi:hypothetical protein
LPRVHSRLDYLERDLAAERRELLGHEYDAKTPFADLLEQMERADPGAGALDENRFIGQTKSRRPTL